MSEIGNGIRVFKALKQVRDIMKQNMAREFKELEVTGPQGMVIRILSHYGEMKISDLSEKMGLSNSTVSGIIDRLEKQGFVERIRSKQDRRVVYINVTDKFRKTAKEGFGQIEKKFEDIMNKATSEELDIIFKGLDTLKKLMERDGKE